LVLQYILIVTEKVVFIYLLFFYDSIVKTNKLPYRVDKIEKRWTGIQLMDGWFPISHNITFVWNGLWLKPYVKNLKNFFNLH